MSDLKSIKAAAELERMSRATIRAWIDAGLIRDHGTAKRAARLVSIAEIRAARKTRREAFEAAPASFSQGGRRVRGPDKAPRKRKPTCETCGAQFTPRTRNDREGRFCSLECYRRRVHPKAEPRQCEHCGEWFTPKGVASYVGRFCSTACKKRGTAGYPQPEQRKCEGCGRKFTPAHPYRGAGGSHPQRYCSHDCSSDPLLKSLPAHYRPKAMGKVKGRAAARAYGRGGGKQPIEASEPVKADRARAMRAKGKSLRAIANATGLSKRQLEGLFSRSAEVSP